jgi:hypothetical protein
LTAQFRQTVELLFERRYFARHKTILSPGGVTYTDGMTTDERLDALAQSREVWQHMQMDASKEYEERFRSLDKLFRPMRSDWRN